MSAIVRQVRVAIDEAETMLKALLEAIQELGDIALEVLKAARELLEKLEKLLKKVEDYLKNGYYRLKAVFGNATNWFGGTTDAIEGDNGDEMEEIKPFGSGTEAMTSVVEETSIRQELELLGKTLFWVQVALIGKVEKLEEKLGVAAGDDEEDEEVADGKEKEGVSPAKKMNSGK